jgi:hypothetical protein
LSSKTCLVLSLSSFLFKKIHFVAFQNVKMTRQKSADWFGFQWHLSLPTPARRGGFLQPRPI